MPELPEVETVKRTLQKAVVGKTIESVEIRYEGVIKNPATAEFSKLIKDKTIVAVDRRGKYLIFDLENTLLLAVHLRMTGRMVYANEIPDDKHIHVVMQFKDGGYLYFHDIRKFGTLYLLSPEELNKIRGYAILGPEPLSEQFTLQGFKEQLNSSRKKIKQLLLDQQVVAGLGNIYVDEVLHASAIHPERISSTIDDEEITKLYIAIQEILAHSIEHGGTSFRDYVDGFGKKGSHQNYLKVYQRQNEACPRCGKQIHRIKVSGRSSYHCPDCQK